MATALLVLGLVAAAPFASSTRLPLQAAPQRHVFDPPLPVKSIEKLQWFQNFGYCGETSLIMAGQQYGNWMGQYSMRAIVTGGLSVDPNSAANCPSSADGGCQTGEQSQLLPGVNEARVAASLKLKIISFEPVNQPTSTYMTPARDQCSEADVSAGRCPAKFLTWNARCKQGDS